MIATLLIKLLLCSTQLNAFLSLGWIGWIENSSLIGWSGKCPSWIFKLIIHRCCSSTNDLLGNCCWYSFLLVVLLQAMSFRIVIDIVELRETKGWSASSITNTPRPRKEKDKLIKRYGYSCTAASPLDDIRFVRRLPFLSYYSWFVVQFFIITVDRLMGPIYLSRDPY